MSRGYIESLYLFHIFYLSPYIFALFADYLLRGLFVRGCLLAFFVGYYLGEGFQNEG